MWLLARGSAAGRAIAVGAVGPVVGSVVATLVSDDAIITRYTAVSAPFALVAIGAAAMSLAGPRRVFAIALMLLIALSGSWRQHDRDARFADARAAIDAVEKGWRPTDLVLTPAHDVSVNLPVRYYVHRKLPSAARVVAAEETAQIRRALARRSRVWVVGRGDPSAPLARVGYRARFVGYYRGALPLTVTLGTPGASGPSSKQP